MTPANDTGLGPEDARPAPDASPLMVQYWEVKRGHPDCLLFYRMGDFYELFFDDARQAAAALDIALTKRGKHEGQDIPMCGVPVHAADAYLSRLIRKGFRVGVCEQVEAPAEARKRGAKAVVRREVVRIVTPGTLTEDTLLDARRHNYLVVLAEVQGAFGLASVDISTGDFDIEPVDQGGLGAALARLAPGEIVLSDRLLERAEFRDALAPWKAVMTAQPQSRFDSENGRLRLEALFGVKALDAFGAFTRAELAAGGALVDYVELTQKGRLPRLSRPRRSAHGAFLEIDAATRRNLELTETLAGDRRGSLLDTIDRTATGAGARLLAAHLAAPLTDPAAIAARHDGVRYFAAAPETRERLRAVLARAPDLERALSRLALGRGGPRDLAAIRDGLKAGIAAAAVAAAPGFVPPPAIVARAVEDLGSHDAPIEQLARALAAELPLLARDGGFIAPGFHPGLDEWRILRDEGRRHIAGLQAKYAAETGIATLKIRHNNVLGYFIEVSPQHAAKLPIGGAYIHRQTMAGAVRYSTVELGELEDKIGRAADKVLGLELEIFAELTGLVLAHADGVARAAGGLAMLDVSSALAELAVERRYARPEIDDSLVFAVVGGRHPLVEAALPDGASFVGNDCTLSGEAGARRLWLVTGPNMAGKSTFLRQNALIAVMAQMGGFVPALSARIGVVDRLFSRVGAADDLARGRSTFMVEMVETAAILNQAGPRALVILDEIGRGTATFDGLSIAWATVEHLHGVNRARALFATHYHELTALAGRLDGLSCHTMRVKEWRGEVVFLHEVVPGTADRSYGIHVARLAGLPEPVIGRADEILALLGQGEQAGALARLADDLPLFRATPVRPAKPAEPDPVDAALAALDPDTLSPREALEFIYRLAALRRSRDEGSRDEER